ncbi:hypothetical protein F5Y04DRAFT_250118 [Hypomontagnella monticulosa]|nr:hypothetical protein F5Y04DRAFT_250118 [Hypomontagnella monticulosa]
MDTKTTSRPEAGGGKQSSTFYQAIMTPIYLVSFLLSLYLVDSHYHDKRIAEHAERQSRLPSWLLPSWLDRALFPTSPYEWVKRNKQDPASRGETKRKERWYYHTKQKKLLKMEAADALEIQRGVLLGLCVVFLCALWAFWRLSIGFWAWYTG